MNEGILGNTKLLTENGFAKVESFIDKEVLCWNCESQTWEMVNIKKSDTKKPIYKINFSNGRFVETSDLFEWETKALKDSKIIIVPSKNLREKDKLNYYEENSEIDFGDKEETEAYDYGFNFSNDWFPNGEYNKKSYFQWLAGIFDAKGKNIKSNKTYFDRINIYTPYSFLDILFKIQDVLLELGIPTKIFYRNIKKAIFINISIVGNNIIKFSKLNIPFRNFKIENFSKMGDNFYEIPHAVYSIENTEKEDFVYFTEKPTKTIVNGGINIQF